MTRMTLKTMTAPISGRLSLKKVLFCPKTLNTLTLHAKVNKVKRSCNQKGRKIRLPVERGESVGEVNDTKGRDVNREDEEGGVNAQEPWVSCEYHDVSDADVDRQGQNLGGGVELPVPRVLEEKKGGDGYAEEEPDGQQDEAGGLDLIRVVRGEEGYLRKMRVCFWCELNFKLV